ncbi:cation diffusion facilitator family transporter [Uliginosibacterium gangwonense]|uniref:cation diffusion facilitator family transporter n=1 Tax=Uliginosibacterium gangwonense TaxID=392736 RepID=UPI0003A61BD7|nr:cation diffusion facilitator family transporter [Uliginosibacterium gangwonense]
MQATQETSTHPARSAITFIWLSVAASIATIVLKFIAWWLSGSVGLLSDAMESFVNLAGALFALFMLHIASSPADEDHPFGHSKAEYFSSGFEGTLIFIAAASILYAALPRLFAPQPLQSIGIGLWFSIASTILNYVVSRVLYKAGQRLHSVALEADAAHLMTDVWTSVGVIGALLAVMLTGWIWLDAVIAIMVAIHILTEGWRLMRASVDGLMDRALAPDEIAHVQSILADYSKQDVIYRDLRTRRAGAERFVSVAIMVPGDWTVERAHNLLDEIEERISQALHNAHTSTHLEPTYCVIPTQANDPDSSSKHCSPTTVQQLIE